MSRDYDYWDSLRDFLIVEEAYLGAEEKQAREEEYAARYAELEACARQITSELDAQLQKLLADIRALHVSDTDSLIALAKKTMVYEMLSGIIRRGEAVPFVPVVENLCARSGVQCTDDDVAASACVKRPLFKEVGELNDTQCGEFWAELISHLPPSPRGDMAACVPELYEIIVLTESFYIAFAGSGAEPLRLDEQFSRHHQRASLFCADVEKLKDAIRRQDFSCCGYEYPYRELLASSFPQVAEYVSCGELSEMDEEDLLAAVYRSDAHLAVEMWSMLLDTAGDALHDKAVAARLLGIELTPVVNRGEAWSGDDDYDPILDALERDDRFASQLYQSAFIGRLQCTLLVSCCTRGRVTLMEKLRELMRESPYLRDFWPLGLPKWILALPENNSDKRKNI